MTSASRWIELELQKLELQVAQRKCNRKTTTTTNTTLADLRADAPAAAQ